MDLLVRDSIEMCLLKFQQKKRADRACRYISNALVLYSEGKNSFRISARISGIMTDVFCGFPQSLQQILGQYVDYVTTASFQIPSHS
jgi:hypothetical protein